MTWAQAKIEALRLVDEIAARHGEPSIYPSDAVYRQQKAVVSWASLLVARLGNANCLDLKGDNK